MLKKIAADSVHKICSGQVVLTLAVAVKELIENSLDAGANSIEVRLKGNGIDLIEVIDNGSGVKPENYQTLTLRHFTSKISEFSDVATVETFGFRGEALSSLCSLSDLIVITRHIDQSVASRIEYDNNGAIKTITNCAREPGTTVLLGNLFHTLPVRQKEFNRNIKKEFGRLIRMLQSYCIISMNTKITCYSQTGNSKKQLILSTVPSNSMIDYISCLFGSKQVNQLVPITQYNRERSCPNRERSPLSQGNSPNIQGSQQGESPSQQGKSPSQQGESPSLTKDIFKINGYISKCCHGDGRSTTDRQFFFFNGRPCEHNKLSKTINEVYHLYNKHQYPFVAINIITNKDIIDVNLTPDKRTIFIQDEKLLLTLIKESLINMFDPMQQTVESATPPNHSSPFISATPPNHSSPFISATPSNYTSPATPYTLHIPVTSNLATPTSQRTQTTSCSSSNKSSPFNNLRKSFSYSRSIEPKLIRRMVPEPKITDFGLSKATPTQVTPTHQCSSTITKVSSNCSRPQEVWPSNHNVQGTINEELTEDVINKKEEGAVDMEEEGVVDMEEEGVVSNKEEGVVNIENENVIDIEEEGVVNAIMQDVATPATNKLPSDQDQQIIYDTERCGIQANCDNIVNIDIDSIRARQHRHGDTDCHDNNRKYFHAKIVPDGNKQAEEELKKELNKENFRNMEIIGQFNLGFIIAKLGNNLFIIDQHATDEKYNYERLQRETIIEHQTLIRPLLLELSIIGESVIIENREIFAKNGFQFDIDQSAPPTKRVKLTGQPVSKNWSMGVSEIEELIFLLTDYPGEMVRPSCVNRMFAMRSCRGSIMIGTPLNNQEMKRLLTHMSEMRQPWNCPHGRPTLRHLIDLSRITNT